MLQTTTGRLLDVNKGDVLLTKSGVYVEFVEMWKACQCAIIRHLDGYSLAIPLEELNLEFAPTIQ